jgi:hypothetical protein
MAMSENMVIGDSDLEFGLLEELFKQLKAGKKSKGKKGLTWDHIRALTERRNPFERVELEKVLPYADEEVESTYGYPKGSQVRSAIEQVKALLALKPFKKLDASHVEELASGELPEGADGWAVIPKLESLGKTYHKALQEALNLITKDRKFKNWREGELTEKHLRLTDKTAQAHAELNEQPGDFYVFPFQFGIKYRGRSVRRARVLFTETEFGLGAYEVAILLLTHPDRITDREQLYIDCAGVEYTPSASGVFFACLVFCWFGNSERLALNYDRTYYYLEQWGSASGFLPQ